MEHFLWIVSRPDNIPIVGLLFIVPFCIYMALSQALRHDKRIREGKRDEVYDEMIR